MMNISLQLLRAVSVLLVVLFHYSYIDDSGFFSNGFVGVDIFFILSGYFMSPYLFGAKSLPTLTFLKKRILRLYPSLIPVFILSLTATILFVNHTTYDFALNIKILFASFFGFSNEVLKASLTGYFDTSSTRLIFLHSWSLSVELQFFFLVSLYLLFLRFISVKPHFSIILFLTLVLLLQLVPYNYFSFTSRSWQFFVGILIFYSTLFLKDRFFLVNSYHTFISRFILFPLLLAILIFPLLFYTLDHDSIVLIETLIASLYILLGVLIPPDSFNIAFSNKSFSSVVAIVSFLGLISYELYLVHWPLLSICTWFNFKPPLYLYSSVSLLLSIILYQVYLFYNRVNSKFFVSSLLFIISLFLFLVAYIVYIFFPRMDYRNYLAAISKTCSLADHANLKTLFSLDDVFDSLPEECLSSIPSTILIGDSTVPPLFGYFNEDRGSSVLSIFRNSCLIGLDSTPSCADFNKSLLHFAKLVKASDLKFNLIVSQRYEGYLSNIDLMFKKSSYAEEITLLKDYKDKLRLHKYFLKRFSMLSGLDDITIVTYGPTFPFNYWNCDLPFNNFRNCSVPFSSFSSSYNQWTNELISDMNNYKSYELLSKVCTNSICHFNAYPYIYNDYGHLSYTKQTLNYFFSNLPL